MERPLQHRAQVVTESPGLLIGLKLMLSKSKGKTHCGHMGVVASNEETIRMGLNKGRESLRLGSSDRRLGGAVG